MKTYSYSRLYDPLAIKPHFIYKVMCAGWVVISQYIVISCTYIETSNVIGMANIETRIVEGVALDFKNGVISPTTTNLNKVQSKIVELSSLLAVFTSKGNTVGATLYVSSLRKFVDHDITIRELLDSETHGEEYI